MLTQEKLDPNIRRTIQWLTENGFTTTDSGDGVAKFEGIPKEEQMPCAMPYPNVVMEVTPAELLKEATRLFELCLQVGLDPNATIEVEGQEMPVWQVEASYLPRENVGMLLLTGVNDTLLEASLGVSQE